jgi:protein TonB
MVALVCLLASVGFGIYHWTAKRNAAVEQPTAPVSALKGGPEAALPDSHDSKSNAQPAAAQPSAAPAQGAAVSTAVPVGKPAASSASPKGALTAQTPNSHESGKDTKNSAIVPSTARDVKPDVQVASNKPAGETPREISTPAVANAASAPPAAPPEKPAQPAVTVIENPTPPATRQPEKADNASAPPPKNAPAPPKEEPKSEPAVPAATNRADSPAPSGPPPPKPSVPSVVSPAVAITKITPIYPEAARRIRIKGTVVLDLNIDADGKVIHANLVNGDSVLAEAAIQAVMRWRYKPATVNGKGVASVARVSFVFNN